MKFFHPIFCLIFLNLRFSSANITFNSTALILAVDDITTNQASYLLNGYGIAFQTVEITQSGQELPPLESPAGGNYGLFIIVSQVYGNGSSLLTTDQWQSLYNYQVKYGVRMVHLNVVPSVDFGVKPMGSCCNDGVEQNLTFVDGIADKEFPTAGLRKELSTISAIMSTVSLYHVPSTIIDANASTTTAIAEFQPNAQYGDPTVAAVINTLQDGREQMAFFLAVGNWSTTSSYLGHAWIQWGYRGTYQGYRRIYLQTQVDDLFLETTLYNSTEAFRVRAEDMYQHLQWQSDLNSRLNDGSAYFSEFGFNANGNVIYSAEAGENQTSYICDKPVFSTWSESTSLEFMKPLGTGTSLWPLRQTFDFTGECTFLDPLAQFFANISSRDAVGLVSHTFTHEQLDNATYHDATIEIAFNLGYAEFLNFTNAAKFSGSGLIPPAITGLHNGDVLRAWSDNGLWNAIGDNTRPILRNPVNDQWPAITTLEINGYDGYQITPRFATRIYFNCDQVDIDVTQWIQEGGGTEGGTIYTLLDTERLQVGNQLLSLFHDPYMFHQPNLRSADVGQIIINGVSRQLSLLQMWVETITAEMTRLTSWPLITLKHDHIAEAFNRRMILDACSPFIQYISNGNDIIGFTVLSATGNTCDVPIPVTVGKNLADTQGFVTEQIGSDPLTLWVNLDGQPVSFTFA